MEDSSTAEARPNLTLCMEGVAPHDELLFKSMVRLLSYRTLHNWTFGTGSVDLRILGEESLSAADGGKAPPVLWVGHFPDGRSPFLQLPLHANELERLLNTLGSQILKRQESPSQAAPAALAHDEMFTLQRWPPSSLLGTPAHIKLATLMTSHPVSIDTLARKSGATLEACSQFCQALDHAGMLLRTGAEARPQRNTPETLAIKVKPDLSLLARIRHRLGL